MLNRHPNNTNYMVSPLRSQGEMEESTHSENKKSKNRHLIIINQLRKKEDCWDNRFYLQNIPEYNCIQDDHCETYKKALLKKKSKKFVLKKESRGYPPTDNNIGRRKVIDESSLEPAYRRPESRDRHQEFKIRGMYQNEVKPREKSRAESMRRYTPLAETLMKEKRAQQERLRNAWDRSNIPMFHRESFIKCENLQNMKQTIEIIKREAEELESNCSPIQLALRAIAARENCLKQLLVLSFPEEEHEGKSERGSENEEELKQRASELLTHVRILSLNAVETILKWREYIQQAYYITRGVVKANQTIIIPFLYHERNYLIKMKDDTRILHESRLEKFFNFSTKSDPFLVYPSKEMEHATNKIVLYISKNLINRIRACELVILEESVHKHMNEKNNVSVTGKPLESPSDRSLNKQDDTASQKKTPATIKIRNTNLAVPSQQGGKRSLGGGTNNNTKQTNPSHPGSHNQISDAEGEKKEHPHEAKHEVKHEETHQKSHPHMEKPHVDQEQHQQQHKEKSPKQTPAPKKEEKDEQPETKEATPELKENKKPVEPSSSSSSSSHPNIKPIDLYEDEVAAYMNKYLEGVDHAMKESFVNDAKILLEKANAGQDPTWFEIVEGSKRAGFAVAHIDNTIFTARRMVILHFTTEGRENYQELLGKFVEYLWMNDECNEIKINLFYIEDENQNLGADKQLQECIKKLGFKWKQLTNDKYTNKREIAYVMKRPEGVQTTVVKLNDEPIHVRSVVVLSDLQGESGEKRTSRYHFDNRYSVLTAALKHCDEKLDKLGEGDSKRHRNYLQVISSLIKEDQGKIGDLTGKFNSFGELEEFIKDKFKDKQEFIPHIASKTSANIFSTSLLNLIYRWKSFNVTHHAVAGQDRKYIKINNSNEDTLFYQSKFKGSSVYLIPTDDEQVNVFVADNDALIKDILNKEEIIEDIVSKIFSKLEKTPTPFKQDLWLPLFNLKEDHLDLEAPKTLLKDEYKINYATNSCVIGLNGTRVPGNLKVRPGDNSKIIEKPFLFGIVHSQVDIPLFAALIQPEDFLKNDI